MAKLLIVDDSLFQRGRLRMLAESEGWDVIEAADGREGLDVIVEQSPDVVVLDINMPVMTGIEVLQELKKYDKSVYVIILTADIQETTRTQCLENGAAAVLLKPVQTEEFKAQLKSVQLSI